MLPCFIICGAQGWVCWEEENDPISGPWDYDAVEWFTVLFLPIYPRRAVHTHQWSSETRLEFLGPHFHLATDYSFQAYPLQLSRQLIAKSFLRSGSTCSALAVCWRY
jgi:hypothetical protein